MPQETFFCKKNYDKMKDYIKKICDDLNRDKYNHPIRIDDFILNECFLAAENSVKFYNIREGNISHYKEVSHISFWISKLKPIRIENPYNLIQELKSLLKNLLKHISGLQVINIKGNPKCDKIAKALEFPINEYVSYYLGTDYIRACQLGYLDQLEKENKIGTIGKKSYQKEIERAQEKITLMQDTIIHSIRYHNYSARGFALMIETLTRIDKI